MKIISVKAGGFANGFSYFCPNCGRFFSVQMIEGLGKDYTSLVEYCPSCGEGNLIYGSEKLLEYCGLHCADPVNFYSAFPCDELIPNSRTGATPRQVEVIVDTVIARRVEKNPVTIDDTAGRLDYLFICSKELVKKVFEELHITATGGEK